MSITNPHDLIFKQTESHIENAMDYIRGTFPKNIVQNLDLTTLTLEQSSYTTEELKEFFSDLAFQCNYRGKTKIKITLLFEHKSFKPHLPHIKILRYMLTIWEMQLKEKQALTPII
jgi:predicted transposase/invertase (TIGR01784 family)